MAKTRKKAPAKKKRKVTRRRVKKSEPKEPYFIGLGDPVELRKNILEPTREVIQFLQSYEEFKKLKEEKTHTILQLKEDLKGIKLTINKLRRLLPRSKIKSERAYGRIKKEVVEEYKEKKPKKKPTLKVAPPKPLPKPEPKPAPPLHPELDSLEKELGEIEKKLGTLS